MQWGGTSDERAAAETFHACRAAGVTWFDTAHMYTDGASETMLGRLAGMPEAQGIRIATKVGYTGGASAATIRAQFDISRRRLGVERVDALYLHRPDPNTPLQESIEALAILQRDGLIGEIGLSNVAAWQAMKAQGIAAAFGTRIGMLQPMYSLVKRQAEVEILPMAADQGMMVHSYSPLGAGLLTGKYVEGGTGRLTENARYGRRYGVEAMHRAAAGLTGIAREIGTHPATLAVAWAAHHPAAPRPIISARDAVQLAPSLAARDFAMDDALYARLAALMPGPPPATDRIEEQASSV